MIRHIIQGACDGTRGLDNQAKREIASSAEKGIPRDCGSNVSGIIAELFYTCCRYGVNVLELSLYIIIYTTSCVNKNRSTFYSKIRNIKSRISHDVLDLLSTRRFISQHLIRCCATAVCVYIRRYIFICSRRFNHCAHFSLQALLPANNNSAVHY